MPTAEEPVASRSPVVRPRWGDVLRALREARGVTQEGWAAQLGVSAKTVQRWERGERAPDPGAEAAILAYCRERDLLRPYDRGPLAGLTLSVGLLQGLLAEARWRVDGGQPRDGAPAGPVSLGQPGGDRPGAQGAPQSNLPAQLTSFVGREREIAAVRRALGGRRLLTLTGAGGCGKTRLALRVADELLWAYPHGIWFVDLAALADPALVPQTVAAALGLQATEPRPALEALKALLKSRTLLLVLDNCEHLLPACAALVETLLLACPGMEILITSREPLGVIGETLWRVPPMSIHGASRAEPPPDSDGGMRAIASDEADAVRLFVERARLYRPEFSLTAANADAVVQICEQLDGIPLAIELAAARLKLLTPDQIATRLSDRFQLLTGGGRTALPRHQTLRAAMDWSYELLTPPERAILRRLSVFAGGFTLEAVEAVCEGVGRRESGVVGDARPDSRLPTPDSLDLLSSLVDKSLVIAEEQEGGMRCRLLETVHQYAAEKLDEAGEGAAVRELHRAWCLTLAETAAGMMGGPHEAAWLARLEQEHDNLRAALRWTVAPGAADAEAALRLAGALARFWDRRGHLGEGRRWLEQALAADPGAPAGPRALALRGVGMLAYAQGDYAAARAYSERGLILSEELADLEGVADTEYRLGMVALRCGEHAAARTFLEASLAHHTELGSKFGVALARGSLGFLALRQGDHAGARAHLEAGLALFREIGHKSGIADALDDLATVAGERGDTESQAEVLEECLALYRELGARAGVARVLSDFGMAAWMRGEHDRALASLGESLALYREVGERRGIARVLGNQAVVALSRRDLARAASLSRESLALYGECRDAWGVGRYLPVLAGAAFGQGQVEKAARLCAAAAALRGRLGTPLPPVVHQAHEHLVAAVRRTLGEPAFAAAWAAGAALSLEDAVADALADVAPA